MTKLLDFLPPYFRSSPALKGFVEAVGRPFDYWRTLLGSIGANLDADGAPASWLDWLMRLVGHVHRQDLTERQKRNLIKVAGLIWRMKGIEAGLEYYVRAITGVAAVVVERNTEAFLAGISAAGDPVGAEVDSWTFEIHVPTGSIDEDDLRELLKIVAPTFCTYTVIYT